MSTIHHDSLFLRQDPHQGSYGLVQMTPIIQHAGKSSDADTGNSGGLSPMNSYSDQPQDNGLDDDDDDDEYGSGPLWDKHGSSNSAAAVLTGWKRWLLTPLLPDDHFTVLGQPLLDGVRAVRCAKFFAVTLMGLFFMFYFVRWMVRACSIIVRFAVWHHCLTTSSLSCCFSFVHVFLMFRVFFLSFYFGIKTIYHQHKPC